jgi:hypothetical protein
MTADANGGSEHLFDTLERQLQRMLACRSEEALDPTFVEEEATLCDLLLPVLIRLAGRREEWANGALAELCRRWRRGLVTCITPHYLRLCIQEAARQDRKGWLPLVPEDAPAPPDPSPGPMIDLIHQEEDLEAEQARSRLLEEVVKFVESLEDPQLQELARAMLQATDLAWGFFSRYAREKTKAPSAVTKMKQALDERFRDHLRKVGDFPAIDLSVRRHPGAPGSRGGKAMNTPYALFDPHSQYNALRASLMTREKIRGYFLWRRTRRAHGLEHPGPSPDRPPLVFRGGSPPVRLQAQVTIPRSESLPGRYTITVRLDPRDAPPPGTACRAFLIEQGVLDRLRALATPAVVCREGTCVTVRDLCTGQVRAEIGKGRDVRAAAVLGEDQVVLQTLEGGLEVWNTVTGELATRLTPCPQDGNHGLVVSATGEVAWGNATGQVVALAPGTDEKRIVQRHPAPVVALTALPDGRLASAHADGVVCVGSKICVAPEGDPVGTLTAWGENGVAFTTPGGQVHVWSLDSDCLESLSGQASWLASLPDGRLAVAGTGGLTVWEVGSSVEHFLTDAPTRIILAAPGARLVKVAEDGSLWGWNLRTGTERLLQARQSGATFIDPLACGRLRPSLPGEEEAALSYLLDHRVLSEEFSTQQALSALPELEGQWQKNGITLDAEVPDDSPNISSRARVVVVLGPGA